MKLIIDIDEEVYKRIKDGHPEPNDSFKCQDEVLYGKPYEERPQGEWGKWIITEIQCPTCFGYFETDCYSKEELKKCPNCGADMRGGAENV